MKKVLLGLLLLIGFLAVVMFSTKSQPEEKAVALIEKSESSKRAEEHQVTKKDRRKELDKGEESQEENLYQNGVKAASQKQQTASAKEIVECSVTAPADNDLKIREPQKVSADNKAWPLPQKARVKGTVVDYRVSVLPPNLKGGEQGELREWLIEPKEGYTAHVEEEWRPNEKGEMAVVSVCEYAANQVVLTLDGEISFESFQDEMLRRGVTVKQLMELEKGSRIVAVMTPEIDFDSVSILSEAIAAHNPRLSVEKDLIRSVERVPNDGRYSSQWGLSKIQAPAAWDIRTDASSVVVAVIDSGINYNHQDLSGNMWVRSSSASATNFKYGMKAIGGVITGNPMDDNGHGTHCAGIIGAVGNNSTGVSGVAWRTKLMACKTFDSSGSAYTSDGVLAMAWARTNGAHIVSCSYGGIGYSSSVSSAISSLRSAGIIVVAAAGNSGISNDITPHYPSSYTHDNIVAVANTTSSDVLKDTSNYGSSSVDIAAPGTEILSTYYSSSSAYATMSGTSMATPFVSGALALLKAQYPSYTYLQLIQKLYAGGDSLSSLSGKVSTGKRLNVYKALNNTQLVSPVPSASRGTYSDRVYVSWPSVSGASYYRVYRATSSTGTKTALGSWQTATSYSDYSVTSGTTYYYWVCAATSSSGANQSTYASYATGYAQASAGDSWDPGDNTASGGTVITPSTTQTTHGTHTLAANDHYDFFKISMNAGVRYMFETTGNLDTYGELYNSTSTNAAYRVAYNDDASGAANRNFSVEYTPTSSGTYYLRVRAFSVGTSGSYTLVYRRSANLDSWDPGDDTPSGGTSLSPSTSVSTHGAHTLSADDRYDFYRISMTAGRRYVFESTGSYDIYGEIFSSTSTNNAYRVAYDDDSGEGANFRIEYTPSSSATYYLRVRRYTVGADGSYYLKYSYSIPSSYDFGFCNWAHWTAPAMLTASTNTMQSTDMFYTNQTVWICFQSEETANNDVPGPITNCAKVVNNQTGATRFTWQSIIVDGFRENEYNAAWLPIDGLEAGSYTARIMLNEDRNGNRKYTESTYTNNVRTFSFTVVNPQTTLTSIAISGNAAVNAKGTADYRCTGTYSDGSTGDVSPTWSISSGASYANVSSSGRLTAGDTITDKTVTLRAVFDGKTATKTITIRGSGESAEPVASPFPEVVSYPRAPMIVEGVVYINGVLAAEGDQIAAYAGNEVRGVARIVGGGRVTMGVNVAEDGERISFKVWDASEGDNGTIFNCMQSLAGSSDPQGTATSPIRLDAAASDPFGQVTPEPLVPPTIIEASVSVDGEAASAGDILAVFSGNTVVGKAPIFYENHNGVVSATCRPVMFFSGRKTLSFRLWDADKEEILECSTTLTVSSGDITGTVTSPYEISFSSINDNVPCELDLNSGWNLVSFSVLPDNPSPANVFADVTDSVLYVSDVTGNLWGPSIGNSGLSTLRLGAGYWVRSSDDDVTFTVEGRGNSETQIALQSGWNLIGYTLPQAGTINAVLRTALASGKVQYIADQFGNVYPGGLLSEMRPGVGYWVRTTDSYSLQFDRDGMSAMSASLAGIASEGGQMHPFGTPVVRMGLPTIFQNMSVSLFGKTAAYGDYLAVFDRSTGELLTVQQVNSEDGTLTFSLMGLRANDKLYFKVWNSASGLNAPEIFTSAQSADFTVSNPDDPVVDYHVEFSGTSPSYSVTYNLDNKAVRTGGGQLTQTVAFGGDAVDPTIAVNSGYRFIDWNYSKRTDIRGNMEIVALYEVIEDSEIPETPQTYTVRFDANGGNWEGTAWVTQRVVNAGAEIGSLPIPVRNGFVFNHWWTDPVSGMLIDYRTVVTSDMTLYAHWIELVNPDVPANDDFSDAEEIVGLSGSVTGFNINGTSSAGEFLNDVYGSESTVWYRWIAPATARVRFDTVGSDFDTVLGVLEDAGNGMQRSVGVSDDEGILRTSKVEFQAISGRMYWISVGGYSSSEGNIVLNWRKIATSSTVALESISWNDETAGGTVSGGGTFTPGQTITLRAVPDRGCVFVGWYINDTPVWWGDVDYRTPTFPYVVTDEDVTIVAMFATPEEDRELEMSFGDDDEDDFYTEDDGSFELDLNDFVYSLSLPRLTVTGLPSGISYDSKSLAISGKATKPGVYIVKVSCTNKTVTRALVDEFTIVVPNLYDDEIPIDDRYGPYVPGVAYKEEIYGAEGCVVNGLPSGMKWNARESAVTGTPKKPGEYTVYFTKVVGGIKHTATATFEVGPYPRLEFQISGGDGCKVSGAGSYPAGKKVNLKATAASGWVFAGWGLENSDGSLSDAAWLMQNLNPSLSITTAPSNALNEVTFIRVKDDYFWIDELDDPIYLDVGEDFAESYGISFIASQILTYSYPTVKIQGLPSGLKFNAKTLELTGSAKKEGVYYVTVSGKNASGYEHSQIYTFVIGNQGIPTEQNDAGINFAEDDFVYFEESLWTGATWVSGGFEVPVSENGKMPAAVTISGLPTGVVYEFMDGYGDSAASVNFYSSAVLTKPGRYKLVINVTYSDKSRAKSVRTVTVKDSGSLYVDVLFHEASTPEMGSVSGAGVYSYGKAVKVSAKANKGYVFAGWYYLDIDEEEESYEFWENPLYDSKCKLIDYRTASMTKAIVDDTLWNYVPMYARFVRTEDDKEMAIYTEYTSYNEEDEAYEGIYHAVDGWVWNLGELQSWYCYLSVFSESLPGKLTLKGLPSGFATSQENGVTEIWVNDESKLKPGVYKVTVSVSNVSKAKKMATFSIVVPNLTSPALPELVPDEDYYSISLGVAGGGQAIDLSLGYGYENYTLTASGLPSGLKLKKEKLDDGTYFYYIDGTPAKAGTYTVTFTVKNGAEKEVATITLTVNPIPEWAVGSFNGGVVRAGIDFEDLEQGELSSDDRGTMKFSLSAAGKGSAKMVLDNGETVTFGYSRIDYVSDEYIYIFLDTDSKMDDPVTVILANRQNENGFRVATCYMFQVEENGYLRLQADMFKNTWSQPYEKELMDEYIVGTWGGKYEYGDIEGLDDVQLKISKNGSVVVTGIHEPNDGVGVAKKISASGVLVNEGGYYSAYVVAPDKTGRHNCFLYVRLIVYSDGSISIYVVSYDS